MIRVVIADNEPAIRHLVRDILAATPDMRLVAGVERGDALCPLLAHTPADVVLLDVTMPGRSGWELLPVLRRDWPQVPVVMFTARDQPFHLRRAAERGAAGYVVKPCEVAELVDAIRTVRRGGRYVSPSLGPETTRLFLETPPAAGVPDATP